MATSLGKIARAEIVDVSTQLYFGTTAQTNTLPVAGAGKVTLKDSSNNDRRLEVLDSTDTPSFAVWQRGTLYTKDSILPNYADNPTPAECTLGEPNFFWQGVYANAYNFPDGTQQTTAAAPSSLTQTHENSQAPTITWTENPVFTETTKHYKVILRNVRSQGTGQLDLNFYSAAGNIIAGEFFAVDYRNGAFNSAVVIPGNQSFTLTEPNEDLGAGQLALVEIDFYQSAGTRGNITINTTYLNSSARVCRRSLACTTNGTQATGINLRSSGGQVQGDIEVHQYV